MLSDAAHLICPTSEPCVSAEADYHLFVYFSPDDCAIGLYKTVMLNELRDAVPASRLNIIGISPDLADHALADQFLAATGIRYPIYTRVEALERFVVNPRPQGFNKPVAILLRADGTVVDASVAATSIAGQRSFVDRITTLILS